MKQITIVCPETGAEETRAYDPDNWRTPPSWKGQNRIYRLSPEGAAMRTARVLALFEGTGLSFNPDEPGEFSVVLFDHYDAYCKAEASLPSAAAHKGQTMTIGEWSWKSVKKDSADWSAEGSYSYWGWSATGDEPMPDHQGFNLEDPDWWERATSLRNRMENE